MQTPYSNCPTAGYPQPPSGGCSCGNPGPAYIPPPPPQSWPVPSPIPAMSLGAGGPGDTAMLTRAAQAAASFLGFDISAADVDNAVGKTCSGWKTDGINETNTCCTPGVGRYGVKVALCVKITRPYDPWKNSAGLGFGADVLRPQ